MTVPLPPHPAPGTVPAPGARRLPPGDLALVLLLVGWALVAWGIASAYGTYSAFALVAVLTGSGCVVAGVVAGPRGGSHLRALAAAVTAAGLFAAVAASWWRYPAHNGGPWRTVAFVLFGAAGAVAGASLLPRLRSPRWPFRLSLGLAVAAALADVHASPRPGIDVWWLLRDSTSGLVHGDDMYRQSWPGSTGLKDVYPYLPGTSVLLAPFRLLLGDVRVGLTAAAAGAAVLLHRIGRDAPGGRRAVPAALPLLVVLFPKGLYALQQSWTEPLLVVCLVATVAAVRAGRPGVAVLALAAALASKQHIVLLLPLAGWWTAFGWRRTAQAAGLAALVVAPWVVAGPRDFWHDAVRTNLDYPVLVRALDLPALAARHGVTLGFGLTLAALGLAYGLAFGLLPRHGRPGAYGFCTGGALVVLALDLTNKQSFFNHYTLAMALLVTAVVVALADRDGPGTGPAQRVVENRSSDSPSSSAWRVARTVRSRRAASWSDTAPQVPSSVR